MSTKHPTERGGDERSSFNRFAQVASNFTSSPIFFGICIALVLAWVASYVFGFSANVRDFLGYGMAAVALLLLALLKNSELRAEHAVQQKLDAIAAALLQEHGGDTEKAERELERAIGMHEEV